MKISKCLFPFAPKGKLSATTVALHLAVYGALIWSVLQLTRRRVENFQTTPDKYYYAVYPKDRNMDYTESVKIPDGYYVSNVIAVGSGGSVFNGYKGKSVFGGSFEMGSGGSGQVVIIKNPSIVAEATVKITQNSQTTHGNTKVIYNVRDGNVTTTADNGYEGTSTQVAGDGGGNPGSGLLGDGVVRNGACDNNGGSSGASGVRFATGSDAYTGGTLCKNMLFGKAATRESGELFYNGSFGGGGVYGTNDAGGWIPTPGETTVDNTTISGALLAQGISIPPKHGYTDRLGNPGIVIFEYTKIPPPNTDGTGVSPVPKVTTEQTNYTPLYIGGGVLLLIIGIMVFTSKRDTSLPPPPSPRRPLRGRVPV